jgi:hypothetical protein
LGIGSPDFLQLPFCVGRSCNWPLLTTQISKGLIDAGLPDTLLKEVLVRISIPIRRMALS